MPEQNEKNVALPESITLGGIVYPVKETPELQRFIQEVAKVEKNKLYSRFESIKSELATLSQAKIEQPSVGNKELIDSFRNVFITKEDFKNMLPDVVKEAMAPVLQATEQNRIADLNAYREKLIQDNLATCIPDLVKGDTKEALEQSLKESIRLRAAYPTPSTAGINPSQHVTDPLLVQQAQQMTGQPVTSPATPQTTPQPSAPQMPPMAPRRAAPEVSGPTNVKGMSMGEFSQKRDALRRELESLLS